MARAETARLIAELSLKDNLSKGLRSAETSLKSLDKSFGRTQRSLGQTAANIGKLGLVAGTAAAGGLLASVNAAADYESAFAGVRKTVDATEPQLQELSDQFRALAKEIPITAAELARLGEAGGSLGIPTESLKEFVRVTALLGVTTDLTADQAAESLGVIGNVLQLTAADYERFASSLVALGNAGASTESAIIAIAGRMGATAKQVGITTDQILGFSSAAASLDPTAVEAFGTAYQKFFQESTKFVGEAGDELAIFAKVSGRSSKQFAKDFEANAGLALRDFLAGLGKLDKYEKLAVLEDLGFNEARLSRLLTGLSGNIGLLDSQLNIANDSFEENTALTKEASERFKTFDSQLQITKNVLNDIAITIGSKLLPKLTPLLQRLNAFVSENQGNIEKFGGQLADGFEEFADAVGKVDWTPFIDGLRISADIAKQAIGLFMSLPPDVQKIAIAALAVNKVTGGLGSSIIKDLAGLALGSLKTINAAHVTVVGASVTGGVPGVAGGGGAGGVVGTVASGAAKVIPLAVTAGLVLQVADIFDEALRSAAGDPGGGGGIKVNFGPLQNIIGKSDAATARGASAIEEAQRWGVGELKGSLKIGFGGLSLDERETRRATDRVHNAVEDARSSNLTQQGQIRQSLENARLNAVAQAGAQQQAAERIRSATVAGNQQVAFAVRDKDLSVNVDVFNNISQSISIRDQIRTEQKYKSTYRVAE